MLNGVPRKSFLWDKHQAFSSELQIVRSNSTTTEFRSVAIATSGGRTNFLEVIAHAQAISAIAKPLKLNGTAVKEVIVENDPSCFTSCTSN